MNKNINKLIELMKENEELEVIAMVDEGVVADDGYARWLANFGKSRVDETYSADERIYFKSIDIDKMKDDFICDNFDFRDENITDEDMGKKADEYIKQLEWEKVIIVNIDTP